jgi:hypothetical protein
LLTENLNNLAPHELITLLLLIYFRRETTLEEISGLLDLEELQVGEYLIALSDYSLFPLPPDSIL